MARLRMGETIVRRSRGLCTVEVEEMPEKTTSVDTQTSESEYYASCAAVSDAMLIRDVLPFAGFGVDTLLFFHGFFSFLVSDTNFLGDRQVSVLVKSCRELRSDR